MLTIPTTNKLNIHLIGAGGTGGYALEYLARLLAGQKHTIHVYDGDKVEAKNLKRQNFTMSELDMNKAEALTARIQANIHQAPTMVAHPGYITDKGEFLADLMMDLDEADETLVIVMAVDNVATRRLINEIVMDDLLEIGIPAIVMDSGNDDQGGQVALYANATIEHSFLTKTTSGMLPTMLQIYPEIDKIVDENPGLQMNCADNAESQPQAMMANVRNGELLANILIRIHEAGCIAYNLWTSDLLTGNTSGSFTGFNQ